jgi:hypothetical protein
MRPLPVIKSPPRGNAKLGDVLTDSRPTGKTCPDTCPFKQSGKCYSLKGEAYHPGPIPGWDARDAAREARPADWRANRIRCWTKEADKGNPVRFLVHGDLMTRDDQTLDRNYLSDILRAARHIPNFKGWAYTHAWRYLRPATIRHLAKAGITLWASCHSAEEALNASKKGFPIALVSSHSVKGYKGPRTIPDSGAGRPAVVCPHQLGRSKSCLECGYCWNGNKGRKTDLVLLAH